MNGGRLSYYYYYCKRKGKNPQGKNFIALTMIYLTKWNFTYNTCIVTISFKGLLELKCFFSSVIVSEIRLTLAKTLISEVKYSLISPYLIFLYSIVIHRKEYILKN